MATPRASPTAAELSIARTKLLLSEMAGVIGPAVFFNRGPVWVGSSNHCRPFLL